MKDSHLEIQYLHFLRSLEINSNFLFLFFFACERKKYLHNSNLMYMTMTERKVNSVNSRKTCLWISDLRYHKMIKKQERCTSSTRARRINRSPIVLQSQQLSLETRHQNYAGKNETETQEQCAYLLQGSEMQGIEHQEGRDWKTHDKSRRIRKGLLHPKDM